MPAIREAMVSFNPKLGGEPDVERLAEEVETAWDISQERRPFTQIGSTLPRLITEVRATIPVVGRAEQDSLLRTASTLYFLPRGFTKRVGAQDVSLLAADRAMQAAIKANDLDYRAASAWNLDDSNRAGPRRRRPEGGQRRGRRAGARPVGRWTGADEHLRGAATVAGHAVRPARGRARDTGRAGRRGPCGGEGGRPQRFRTVFGPTNAGVVRIWVAVEMSKPGEAVRIAQHFDVTGLPSMERRFAYYLDLGRAYSIRAEDVAAVHMLLQAEKESAEELRVNLDARAVVRELLHRETPLTRRELRPLADRMHILTA